MWFISVVNISCISVTYVYVSVSVNSTDINKDGGHTYNSFFSSLIRPKYPLPSQADDVIWNHSLHGRNWVTLSKHTHWHKTCYLISDLGGCIFHWRVWFTFSNCSKTYLTLGVPGHKMTENKSRFHHNILDPLSWTWRREFVSKCFSLFLESSEDGRGHEDNR